MIFPTSVMRSPAVTIPASIPWPRCPAARSRQAGMTLLEMTVVILVLMSMISVLFFGAQAWKRGSDRAQCILLIRSVQQGVRSYSNLYGLNPGSMAPNLRSQVIGFGRFVEQTPQCPGNGDYTFGQEYGNEVIPPIGSLYMDCSLAGSDDHVPEESSDW
jgi:type II secretory pathway pseudopilin PulG